MIKKTEKDVTRKEFNAENKLLAKHIEESRMRNGRQSSRLDKIDKHIEDSRVRAENQKIRDEK
ncbi:hypothetical protein [Candidatus Liberibacter sp.]|uniref:hypothetical protein n=1 Tax=Candidatus Liberibacter sp. TaxID=34022 RepID=UPI0015F72F5A|nr:hypothetical protein [Candidatus Liberibacter sp.]MBA5724282.1 hypothetical protein [Candidatus Liberibacter sp.]